MSKIVFFDIDGTLLDHEKKLPENTKKAIQLLKQSGVYTAIATGRAPFMFVNLREELEIESFVSFNGQYVVFENEVIYHRPFSVDQMERLEKEANGRNHPLVFMTDKTMKSNIHHHRYIEESLGTLKFSHPEYSPHYYRNHDIYQALLFCKPGEEAYYEERFSDFRFIRWHEYSVDVLPAGGSKAEGIKKLIAKLGFRIEDVYAFGDGLNDIEMLQTVGTGVAMGNALPPVKKQADIVTKDVAEDGIYEGLKKLQLI
jgi:Cof subfamily protein (haloacid dehalogenase superfamily)